VNITGVLVTMSEKPILSNWNTPVQFCSTHGCIAGKVDGCTEECTLTTVSMRQMYLYCVEHSRCDCDCQGQLKFISSGYCQLHQTQWCLCEAPASIRRYCSELAIMPEDTSVQYLKRCLETGIMPDPYTYRELHCNDNTSSCINALNDIIVEMYDMEQESDELDPVETDHSETSDPPPSPTSLSESSDPSDASSDGSFAICADPENPAYDDSSEGE
jgi:hypothetical protein